MPIDGSQGVNGSQGVHTLQWCHLRHILVRMARKKHITWKKHIRTDARKESGREFASFRPLGIAFSSEFVKNHALGAKPRVSLFIDELAHRIGFQFHNHENDPDSYALGSDGGLSPGRWLQSRSIYETYPWLGEILAKPIAHRRFLIKKAERNIFYVDVSKKSAKSLAKYCDPIGNRTRDCAVRGRRPNR
jgi:hypothetical protein